MGKPVRRAAIVGTALLLLVALTHALAWWRSTGTPANSRSLGNSANGSLEGGISLPPRGAGFASYSVLGTALGRQFVHPRVRDALVATFRARSLVEPTRTFITGESGWPHGGRIRPHRTHQNGLSADIFVPLLDANGAATDVPTWPWNGFGYAVHFDDSGRRGDTRIDFECLAAMLLELDTQSRQAGLHLQRIILEPELQPLLLDTPSGRRFGPLSDRLMKTRPWIRHDQHVHVDFELLPATGTARPGE